MKQIEYGWTEEQHLLSPEVITSWGEMGFTFVGLFDISTLQRGSPPGLYKWLYLYARESPLEVDPIYEQLKGDLHVSATGWLSKLQSGPTPPIAVPAPEEPKVAADSPRLADYYRYYLETFTEIVEGNTSTNPPAALNAGDAAAARAIGVADGIRCREDAGTLPRDWADFEEEWETRKELAVKLRADRDAAAPDVIDPDRPRIPK